ncbi:diacylglycerol/lipid kinase family protein [Bacillus ndiopicus]|uniref:diacylglycerol/lipid kinase family protein n=1 Tax=Bacillus ndiopicus TaxID=1347368 RepID=UPI0005AB01D9|nr:YegS/Rv2252/BmrU family lipid kinase [Bacillus ndiopicus]
MQLHIILNELAGSGRGGKRWRSWQPAIKIPYTLHTTNYRGHGFEIAQQIAQDAEQQQQATCIVIIGGDGTIHEVINGVLHCEWITIGVMAGGSGNDYARTYHTFQSVQQLLDFMQRPARKQHDCGIIKLQKEHAFMNNCGIGFDAAVTKVANDSTLKRLLGKIGLGQLSYVYYLIKQLFTFKPFELTITKDGEQHIFHNVWLATVCNQPYFGGGMKLSPLSKTDDHMLEVIVVHNISAIKLLLLFMTIFSGTHIRLKEVTQLTGQKFQLTHSEELLCQADGEILTVPNKQLQFHVNPLSWYATKNE